ncbi:MAG: SDR family oxidoreductase [Candidatus Omnitrophica bacterium]|nr:SDR family oxidoreductase [Candidatus Omnitrophota bacterium]MBU1047361.1 SDR family oxidoreductase [Candidatus Omnitrophota bacterium]MBU1630863.1 SDR family oxidoreductase [Candidatus Omnitrophota bacterium]MBU1889054.1 SDR family oxidoreductase [Candidatus Omnitrophota bacterium]
MRILILGGSGMLGHKLWQYLSPRFPNTFTVIRGYRHDYKKFNIFEDETRVIENLNALNFPDVEKLLDRIQPSIILNCIGMTKHRKETNDMAMSLALNSSLPHKLATWGENNNAKTVVFSTDCVFDGKIGHYTEESLTSATDIYGKTKAKGELKEDNTLTLRSSFIGTELLHRYELLEWFLAQSGTIKGYKNAIYSGFTTLELCRIVEMLIVDYPQAHGLYNVSSNPISKFDLLMLIKKKMNLDIEITPDEDFHCDRSLDSSKFRKEFGYTPPSWEKMIDELVIELKGRKQ